MLLPIMRVLSTRRARGETNEAHSEVGESLEAVHRVAPVWVALSWVGPAPMSLADEDLPAKVERTTGVLVSLWSLRSVRIFARVLREAKGRRARHVRAQDGWAPEPLDVGDREVRAREVVDERAHFVAVHRAPSANL